MIQQEGLWLLLSFVINSRQLLNILTMTTIHFIMITILDGEEFRHSNSNTFRDPAEAEDILHSMECGVFDDDYVRYIAQKIVYELDNVEEEAV